MIRFTIKLLPSHVEEHNIPIVVDGIKIDQSDEFVTIFDKDFVVFMIKKSAILSIKWDNYAD
jgi:hypothetical protein